MVHGLAPLQVTAGSIALPLQLPRPHAGRLSGLIVALPVSNCTDPATFRLLH